MKTLLLITSVLLVLSGCSSAIQTTTQYYQFEQPIESSSRNVSETSAQLRVQTVVLRGALNNLGIAMKIDNNQIHAANIIYGASLLTLCLLPLPSKLYSKICQIGW